MVYSLSLNLKNYLKVAPLKGSEKVYKRVDETEAKRLLNYNGWRKSNGEPILSNSKSFDISQISIRKNSEQETQIYYMVTEKSSCNDKSSSLIGVYKKVNKKGSEMNEI
ncbi:MAG TPA: hypothetical protein DG753_00125 [Clostridium sp.]|nr:hypothetical protein [Clostridium sp.]